MLRVISLLGLLILAGCASVPEPIKVAEDQPLVGYSRVTASPDSHQGKTARWGGVIAAVDNLNQQTRLEVVHYPLASTGRPQNDEASAGRFRVYVDGFLDPMVFKKGKSVTVLGKVSGVESGLVGEHEYRFPTLQADSYYLWKAKRQVESTTISIWGGYGWHGWSMWPHYTHRRVIVHKTGSGSDGTRESSSETPKSTSPRVRTNRPEGTQMRPINTDRSMDTEKH